jgi:hypothetical protein
MRNTLDALSTIIQGFNYGVAADDFVFYELGRMLEEDRGSFEDEEFRRLIDDGIQRHVEDQLPVRANLAARFRLALPGLDLKTHDVAMRVIHAIENVETDLRNVAVIVGSYTAYLFEKLENLGDAMADQANQQEVQRRTAAAADLLFEAPDDRASAETAIELLGRIRTLTSSRVLAHVIAEPMLEETLEEKAYQALRSLWPLPRHYMLYELRSHTHQDLPFRWFQLLLESSDIIGVDLILEEFRMHGKSAAYQEDLAALSELLSKARDPETEEKVLQLLNDPETPRPVADMLEEFIRNYRKPEPLELTSDPWARRTALLETNRRYRKAARLYDSAQPAEARKLLREILDKEPDYPFAVMLDHAYKLL